MARTREVFDALRTDEERSAFLETRRTIRDYLDNQVVPKLQEYCGRAGAFLPPYGSSSWDLEEDQLGLGDIPPDAKKKLNDFLNQAGITFEYYGSAIKYRGNPHAKKGEDKKGETLIPANAFLELKANSVTLESLAKLNMLLDTENAKLAGFASRTEYRGEALAREIDAALLGENPEDKVEIFAHALRHSAELPDFVKRIGAERNWSRSITAKK